jgi:hypothetical protein
MKKHIGSCLCGEVLFEVSGDFKAFYLCHCSRCRKTSGSAHASNLFIKEGELKWLSGESLVKSFFLPNTRFASAFCSSCGSKLPMSGGSGENKIILIPAGSLDCAVEIKPKGHIFVGSRANWDYELERVCQYQELPK